MLRNNVPEKGLLGRPLLGTFKVTISPARQEEHGAMPLDLYLTLPEAGMSEWLEWSPLDNQEHRAVVPDGSVKAYVANRPTEFGGSNAWLKIEIEYKPAPGESITIPFDQLPKVLQEDIRKSRPENLSPENLRNQTEQA